MINRLRLDFTIPTLEERIKFINKYVEGEEFKKKPLTSEELEMCGNYLLWGKDSSGKNAVQKKEVQIETRNKTWSREQESESLEALLESPTFNENNIVIPTAARPKAQKEVFSRSKALKEAPDELKVVFENLFRRIDRLDLLLNYYDLAHGKRKNPPRDELLNRFSQSEQEELKEESTHLNQFTYLKLRHQLVEFRKEQFSLRDSYSFTIRKDPIYNFVQTPITRILDTDILVFPFGFKYDDQKISELIFKPLEELVPATFSEKDLKDISDFYWVKQKEEKNKKEREFFDFRELEHLYNFLITFDELEDATLLEELESTTKYLIETFKYYAAISDLSDIYKEILDLKIQKKKNQDIANYINQKYQKSYTSNYISTIFKQKIIKKIADAAAYHQRVIELIFFPEEFKTCNTCGRTLLKCSDNFVRKERSKDGFTNRCKKCDKEERKKKKGG
jgi:hypothetical protein